MISLNVNVPLSSGEGLGVRPDSSQSGLGEMKILF
jgi:hypothetical protein